MLGRGRMLGSLLLWIRRGAGCWCGGMIGEDYRGGYGLGLPHAEGSGLTLLVGFCCFYPLGWIEVVSL